MARTDSINILLTTSGKDKLAEAYGNVIANVQKRCISQALKNNDLSGTPGAGTYEAKRFANRASNEYGTARSGGKGQAVKAEPVVVSIDTKRELVTEVEQHDVTLYGVDHLVARQAEMDEKSMQRELERAFFAAAAEAATAAEPASDAPEVVAEALIQAVETVENDYVDGVERDEIAVGCSPAFFGALRTYMDKVQDGGADGAMFGNYHGVQFYSCTYLPAGAKAIAMHKGAVAQPVLPTVAPAERIQLSNAIGFGLFFSYGTKVVEPDLVFKY
jgi:hypothetical protein